MILVVHSGSGI